MENVVAIRTARESDHARIGYFLDHAAALHRHLDWRSPNDWLGNRNFLITQDDREITGMLICTAEPNEVHWVRVFGSLDYSSLEKQWDSLFKVFLDQSRDLSEPLVIAVIAYFDWMKELMDRNGWKVHQQVVQLQWKGTNFKKLDQKWPAELVIRPMSYRDLATVTRIDQECFPFIWTQSQDVIARAFDQSSYTTVAMLNGEIVGFQISTAYKSIAHLARLAVAKDHQGRYIGQALTQDMLKHFSKPWIREVTVNTQHDNDVSLNLYKKMGFIPTGETYPIYIYRQN